MATDHRAPPLRRFMARCIDEVLVLVVQGVTLLTAFALALLSILDREFDPEVESGFIVLGVLVAVAGWALGVIYEIVSASLGASLGKLIFGLRIIDRRTALPLPLPLPRSIVRWLLASSLQPTIWLFALNNAHGTLPTILVTVAATGLGVRAVMGVSVLLSSTGEGLHDLASESAVVRRW